MAYPPALVAFDSHLDVALAVSVRPAIRHVAQGVKLVEISQDAVEGHLEGGGSEAIAAAGTSAMPTSDAWWSLCRLES